MNTYRITYRDKTEASRLIEAEMLYSRCDGNEDVAVFSNKKEDDVKREIVAIVPISQITLIKKESP